MKHRQNHSRILLPEEAFEALQANTMETINLEIYNIWIPDNDTLQLRTLRDHHDVQAVGHPGRARTLELVSRNFYWPGQRKYILRYVDHCDTCHHIKPIRHVPFGLL